MAIGSIVFDAQWNALTEARASIRVGRVVVARCLCGSFASQRVDTDQGSYEAITASVKMKKADWPEPGKIEGKTVDFCRNGSDEWKTCRVAGTSETDGILSLVIEAEFV